MTLLLDSEIRDWVVLPLFVIMVVTGLLRQNVSMLLRNDPSATPKVQQRMTGLLRCTSKVRSGAANYVTSHQWHTRRNHYVELLKQEAARLVNEDHHDDDDEDDEQDQGTEEHTGGEGTKTNSTSGEEAAPAAAQDPMAAMMNPMSMMKGNMVFMVQNMVMMQGISHFFSGFILLKIPFPLTAGFKPMFQRGLYDLPTLEASYVSSVSWYFLVMFGLRGFFRLVIGDPSFETRHSSKLQAKLGFGGGPAMAPPGGPDPSAQAKQLHAEAENLEFFIQPPKSSESIDAVEKRLLTAVHRYPKKKKALLGSEGIASTIATDTFMKKKKRQ